MVTLKQFRNVKNKSRIRIVYVELVPSMSTLGFTFNGTLLTFKVTALSRSILNKGNIRNSRRKYLSLLREWWYRGVGIQTRYCGQPKMGSNLRHSLSVRKPMTTTAIVHSIYLISHNELNLNQYNERISNGLQSEASSVKGE